MARLDYIRKEYSVAELAYMAGIIDGEGSIYIGNFSKNPKTGTPYFQTAMQVSNTEYALIDWLLRTFGGLINKRTRRQMPANSKKDVWIWTASGDRLTHICEVILPYVVIKVREIEIMLKMRATYSLGAKKGNQGVLPLDDDLIKLRQSYMDEMRSLHCRTYSYKTGK